MRKVFLVCAAAIAFVACKSKTQLEIKGTIKSAKAKDKVYLSRMDTMDDMNVIDSTNVNDKGEFMFTQKSDQPTMYRLQYGEMSYPVIAQNGDVVTLNTSADSQVPVFETSGNKEADKLNDFSKMMFANVSKIQDLQKQFQEALSKNPSQSEALRNQMQPKYFKIVSDFNKESIDFANQNTDNLAGLYAIINIDPEENDAALVQYADKIKDNFKNQSLVQSFVKQVESTKATAIGSVAPDFSGKTPDGKVLKLSDFKGKYILVDFWASWCGPCRAENPNVVKAFAAYKDKNFDILGFSLDEAAKDWTKAIKDDQLTWNHISDLKGFKSEVVNLYNIRGIPFNFLIGPDGKILAKNLRGEALESELAKVLK